MKQIWIKLELYFQSYEFSNFYGFFRFFSENLCICNDIVRIFLNFYEFKIDFIRAQVMWQNLKRLITHLIMVIGHHLKTGVRGTISFAGESF